MSSKYDVATKSFVRKQVGDLRSEMNTRFDEIDKRFDEVDRKFDEVGKRFDDMDKKLDKMMEHVVDIAGQFKKFDEERAVIAHRQSDHSDRIEKLEATVYKTS